MAEPIIVRLNNKPTIGNRATAMSDAVAQEIRHRWDMPRDEEKVAIAFVLKGWFLALERTLNDEAKRYVDVHAQRFADEVHRDKPEDDAVNANGETIDRVHAPED